MLRIVGAVFGLAVGAVVLVAMRVLVPSLFPQQGGLSAGYYVGSLPTGADGSFSKRDYVRVAGLSFAGFALCFALAIPGIVFLTDRSNTVVSQIGVGVAFALLLLGLLCAASGLLHIAKAIWWRPVHLASPWPREDEGETRHNDAT